MKKIVNVKSENQSGGVTTGEINTGDQRDTPTSNDLPKWAKWTFGIMGAIAAGIAIYAYIIQVT